LNELVEHELSQTDLKSIIDLVARHSWWVSPKIYQEIQVVYPKTRRKRGLLEKRGQVVHGLRLWDNQPASKAFWMALGRDPSSVKNFYVCHIYEDSVQDPIHFSNLANLTAFPVSLQSLSEWKPVRDVLKFHAFTVFNYKGLFKGEPRRPSYYPLIWRHQDRFLSPADIRTIIRKLQEQALTRPEFRRIEESQS